MLYITQSNYPQHWQMLFQKPATTMMEGIIDLHHDIMAFLVIILIFVSFMLLTILIRYSQKKGISLAFMKFHKGHGITHDTALETIWTIIPTIILLLIATPSFALVYALDEIVEPQLTVRVAGRQWYWTYEFPDSIRIHRSLNTLDSPILQNKNVLENLFTGEASKISLVTTAELPSKYIDLLANNLFEKDVLSPSMKIILEYPGFSFDSYLVPTEDLLPGAFRLLEVDRRLVLPSNTNIRLLITAYDVLHSWAVPAFGVKVDAVPGRLNEYFLNVKYNGIFYGQCSEICGVNHAFMPIKVEVTSLELFSEWFAINSVLEAQTFKFVNFLRNQSDPTNLVDFWKFYQLGFMNKNELKNLFVDFYGLKTDEVKKQINQVVAFDYEMQDDLINLLILTKTIRFFDLDQLVDLVTPTIETNLVASEVTSLLLEKVCENIGFSVEYFIHKDDIFTIFTPEICEVLLNYLETLSETDAKNFSFELFEIFDFIDCLENKIALGALGAAARM